MKTLTEYRRRFRYWRDKTLRHNVFRLVDETIIKDRGQGKNDRINLAQVASWQVEYEMVFDIVRITTTDNTTITWLDHHNDLLAILREHIRERELPSTGGTA